MGGDHRPPGVRIADDDFGGEVQAFLERLLGPRLHLGVGRGSGLENQIAALQEAGDGAEARRLERRPHIDHGDTPVRAQIDPAQQGDPPAQ